MTLKSLIISDNNFLSFLQKTHSTCALIFSFDIFVHLLKKAENGLGPHSAVFLFPGLSWTCYQEPHRDHPRHLWPASIPTCFASNCLLHCFYFKSDVHESTALSPVNLLTSPSFVKPICLTWAECSVMFFSSTHKEFLTIYNVFLFVSEVSVLCNHVSVCNNKALDLCAKILIDSIIFMA